jgi:maleate isomerase/arylmalonate decarboxylase
MMADGITPRQEGAPGGAQDAASGALPEALRALMGYAPYGYRARIGLIVPPTNTVNEGEWQRWLPEGVTMHAHRMALHADTASKEGYARLMADIEAALAMLTPARPDVIAYGCTAGSMVSPPGRLTERMTGWTGGSTVTTAGALVDALSHLGARRVAVATPYDARLNAHEVSFLEGEGFEVVHAAGLGFGATGPQEYRYIARMPPELVARHAASCDRAEADALLISCTDFATAPIIARLERERGKPVVTSNQATLWAALRAAGIADTIAGAGRLLGEPS